MTSSSAEMSVPLLNCGVCRSMYREPRLLTCLHSFCHPCLYQLPERRNSEHQYFITCPQCAQPTFLPPEGITGLVHNDFLARMCQDYVSEVQKTLGGGNKSGSSGGSSPGQGPASPSSYMGGRSSGQYGSSQGNYSPRLYAGLQSPRSPSQSAAFTYDAQRSSLPHSSVSSTSTDAYPQSGRRPSVEMLPLRARQRKLSMTPPEVLRIWEGLQHKLNHLQSASLQITYGLENINMAEGNWYQRKQDLRREVQRRTAQLQFFIKRQERLLLAMLDSKDTDDSFLKVADQARNDMRANLKSVVHEAEVVKSVLDLAVDSELLTLGGLLLTHTAPQKSVSMDVPELQFKIPEELSVEDKMGEDFGCFTSATMTRDIYTPEVLQQEVVEVNAGQKEKAQEEEKEAVVTETYITNVTPVTEVTSVSDTLHHVTEMQQVPELKQDEPEEEEEEEESEEEEEEEEEESEEEVIVEETIEIIDGKMHVVSSTRRAAPKKEKPPKPKREKRTTKRKKKADDTTTLPRPEEPRMPSPRGRDTQTRRTANSSTASFSRSEPTPAPETSSQRTGVTHSTSVSSQQAGPPPGSNMSSSTSLSQSRQYSSRNSEASRPTSLSFETSRRGAQPEPQNLPLTRKIGRAEDKPPAELSSPRDSGSKTPSEEHQSTLSKFQNFRESLKQRRRELLGVSIGPGHPGIASILGRERRVQSLDRRASLREIIHHPLSPDVENRHLPGDSADVTHDSGESGDGDDAHMDSTSADKDQTSDASGTSAERTSRPVRRAVSAASDKATKMEFLRETWKKRKELLIQNDAYITTTAKTEAREGEEDSQGGDEAGSSLDDPQRSRMTLKARSRVTDMSQALTGSPADRGMEPVLHHTPPDHSTAAPASTAESPAEAKVMETVDRILQKKNVPVLSPRSPTHPTSSSSSSSSLPPWPSKPSMVVRPRPRDPTALTTLDTDPTASFVPTPLETLQEDETKASPEQKRGLRTTSPSRAEGNKDTLQQVRASIRRKKERWRSLSLT